MYVPKQHEELDVTVLHALIKAHPLATWVTHSGEQLLVNHIPMLLDKTRGEFGTLVGHVARANPVWHSFSATVPSIAVFQGPESYITPSWYPSKHAHGKAVPTWNYAVVHAHGVPRAIEDRHWLLEHLNQLTDVHEADQALPWKVADAPQEFTDRMVDALLALRSPSPVSLANGSSVRIGQSRTN
jgi:transcriptional regulator